MYEGAQAFLRDGGGHGGDLVRAAAKRNRILPADGRKAEILPTHRGFPALDRDCQYVQ
jgi:hypothetical protein